MTNSLKWFLFVLKVFKTGIHSLFIEQNQKWDPYSQQLFLAQHLCISQFHLCPSPPPPPWADPWALAFFWPRMANSRG